MSRSGAVLEKEQSLGVCGGGVPGWECVWNHLSENSQRADMEGSLGREPRLDTQSCRCDCSYPQPHSVYAFR